MSTAEKLEELNWQLGAAVQHLDVLRNMYRDSPNSATADALSAARQEVAKLNARWHRLHSKIAHEWNGTNK